MKLTLLFLALLLSTPTHAGDSKMEMGMYVAVSDIEASTRFYTDLFQTDPYIESDDFVGFQIGGGRFGLMRGEAYAVPMTRGNNAVANIKVADVELEHPRVKQLGPKVIQETIADLGTMKMFMFLDPDGNVIEFFSLK